MKMYCNVFVYKKVDKLTDEFKASEVRKEIERIKAIGIMKMSKDDYIKDRSGFQCESVAAEQYDFETKKYFDDIMGLEKIGFDYILKIDPECFYISNGKNRTRYYLIAEDEPFVVKCHPYSNDKRKRHRFYAKSADDVIRFLHGEAYNHFPRIGYNDCGYFNDGVTDKLDDRIEKFFIDNGKNDLLVKIEWWTRL